MESGALKRIVPTEAAALGMVRAGVCGFFFLSIFLTSFSDLARLPLTLLHPAGALQMLSWSFYDALLTGAGMLTLKSLLLASLLAATVGYKSSVATKSSVLLVLFYEGLLRSFGHFNHDEMPAVYILIVLAFAPCSDAFSIDKWKGCEAKKKQGFVYGYPILLMRALLAWSYFSSGLIKLRTSGLGYFSADTLPTLAITHSLDNLHDTHFKLAFLLPQYRAASLIAVCLVLLWELLFPLAIWSRIARRVILLVGVFFHLGTLLLMNLFFPFHLAMYLVFIDWPAVARKVRGRLAGNDKRREISARE